MKAINFLRIIFSVWILSSLVSCKNEKLSVSQNEFHLSYNYETLSIEIKSRQSWTISSDQSWCSVSPSSGEANSEIRIEVEKNGTVGPRFANLTVHTEKGATETITVFQSSAMDIISSGSWKLAEFLIKEPDTTYDQIPLMPSTMKDNMYNFFRDGNYVVDEGPTKNAPSDPQTWKSGIWDFSGEMTHIILSPDFFFSNSTVELELIELNDSIMKLKQPTPFVGICYFTYTK